MPDRTVLFTQTTPTYNTSAERTWIQGESFGMYNGAWRSDSEGDPYTPCLRMYMPARFTIRVGIKTTGARRISVKVKQIPRDPNLRPRMIIWANPSIGVSDTIILTAPVSSGWVTVGPQDLYFTNIGILRVTLENRELYLPNRSPLISAGPCFWDYFVVS